MNIDGDRMGNDVQDDGSAARRARVERAVQEWCKQLIDLTGRNQLLYYKTLKRGTLELTGADSVAVSSLLAGRSVRLSNLLPPTDEQPDRREDALKRAQAVHRKAVTYFEERGIDTLFLARGMASWATTSSQATPSAPVLLRPLKFTARGAAEADFDLTLHGDWTVNETLLHLLATEFSVHVDPSELLGLLDEGDGGDPARLYERLLKGAGELPDFDIVRRLVVGTFAYTKLPMVKDLQENVDQLVAHDLISAVAGDEEAQATVREALVKDIAASLPDFTPPADEFLILDADASQNHVINAAIAGEPLTIQGPPGTGKSQTISNLIASLTARGKRVLFVAEKRAAIDAVTKRLHGVGLGDLVMDLHGGVTSKKQLAADLAHTLDAMARVPQVDVTDLHHKLEINRAALTDHVAAMHERREPWGVTMWDINERLLGLGRTAVTDLRFSGDRLERLSSDVAREARDHLGEWVRLAEPLVAETSPWTGAQVATEYDAQQVLDLVDGLAHETVPTARDQLDDVLAQTALPAPETVNAWQRTLALLGALATTLSQVEARLFELDLHDTGDALEPGTQGWWSRMNAQLFNGRYRMAKKAVRELWSADDKPGGPQLHDVVTSARDQADEWQQLGGSGIPRLPNRLQQATSSYRKLTDELAALAAFLVTRNLSDRDHRTVGDDVSDLLADERTLFRLPRVHELEEWLQGHHLSELLDGVRAGRIDGEAIVAVFDHAWLSSIRTHITRRDPRLANFDGHLLDDRVGQFRTADADHLKSTAMRVRRAVAEQATAVCDRAPDEDALVRKEANKKSRHLTLRRLFDEAPEVLTALRPCWTMSPLVVSQTLPARPIFDVVIFDEASQVLPADAIPALLRAPQAVVAGDRRQLPPTTFFDGATDTDVDEDEEDTTALATGFESILDVLDALLGHRMLTWHYRSEDERLIAFSNHNIYDSGLTTFPGASADGCLHHVLVPHRQGVAVDTRSSDAEVARVVELMIEHGHNRPGESLGVIAMGTHHANRVEAALRARLGELRDRDLEQFFDESAEERAFVKNLERVQGDERDAIILSVGYGKQPDGRLLYRFGPLNGQGGERRLNVAVSRARRRLTLVSSFSHIDMDPSRSSSQGVELLRRYLKYVESGGLDLGGAEANTPLNPFEIDVKHRLEQAGLDVIPQYGTSGFRIDFAIPHPDGSGRMALAVEADGASYHSTPTARDRDRLRQQVLERLGWRFHRIWSTDWFNDHTAEVAKVVAAFEQALADIDAGRTAVAALEEVKDSGSLQDEGIMAYENDTRPGPRPPVRRGGTISDYSHRELVSLARWIRSDTLLRTEDQTIGEMMADLGFKRRGKRITDALTRAIRDS